MCNMCAMWYKGTTQLLNFDRVEIVFILALFHGLKPSANEARRLSENKL